MPVAPGTLNGPRETCSVHLMVPARVFLSIRARALISPQLVSNSSLLLLPEVLVMPYVRKPMSILPPPEPDRYLKNAVPSIGRSVPVPHAPRCRPTNFTNAPCSLVAQEVCPGGHSPITALGTRLTTYTCGTRSSHVSWSGVL